MPGDTASTNLRRSRRIGASLSVLFVHQSDERRNQFHRKCGLLDYGSLWARPVLPGVHRTVAHHGFEDENRSDRALLGCRVTVRAGVRRSHLLLPRSWTHAGECRARRAQRPPHLACRAMDVDRHRERGAGHDPRQPVPRHAGELGVHLGPLAGDHRHPLRAAPDRCRRVPDAPQCDVRVRGDRHRDLHDVPGRPAPTARPAVLRHRHRTVHVVSLSCSHRRS